MGALLVQEPDVVAHEVQDFGGIAATRAMAFNVHEPAQLIRCGPSRALPNRPALHAEDNCS
jgi:hypothetical protein